MLSELLRWAHDAGYRRAVLETTETWQEVIRFYLKNGFRITHRVDGDVYFFKEIDEYSAFQVFLKIIFSIRSTLTVHLSNLEVHLCLL
jgi:ribosomal protein S18 acetylase RimI-like enzyme